MKQIKICFIIPIFCSLLFFSTGCSWFDWIEFKPAVSLQIVHTSAQLTLAWDPPVTDIPRSPSEVGSYRIYCRDRGTLYWRYLGEVEADLHPQHTISHDTLGDGLYEFAVQAVTIEGRVSPLHTSLDSSADPISGWYAFWLKSD